jgi:hypothetical protein
VKRLDSALLAVLRRLVRVANWMIDDRLEAALTVRERRSGETPPLLVEPPDQYLEDCERRSMTLDGLVAQIASYKAEFGDWIGSLPVFVMGHEYEVEALALSSHCADDESSEEEVSSTLAEPLFTRAEIVG